MFTMNVYAQQSPRRYTTTFTQTPPLIDGLLNDAVWDLVEWSGDFVQSVPEENLPPTFQTEFKVLYDNNNVYFFVRAYDEPDKISKIISRRDNLDGDMVIIEIDSYFDKQTDFAFIAMASGTKGDFFISNGGNNEDDSWNPVWFLQTTIDAQGWCAEMQIPLSQLRFDNKNNEEMVWGLEVQREIYRLQERSHWQLTPRGAPSRINLFGELHGIKNIKPQRQVELMPYVLASMERFEKEEGNPFKTGRGSNFSGGLDGKIGLTNNFTLDFTINPDFGQVEADPSQVNLTAFETFYSEKRPFFIEGKNIFQFRPNESITISNLQSDNLFYSRRIGRLPHHEPSVEDDEYLKMPETSKILGALKISGKTKEGLSVGIMESLTSKESATIAHNEERKKETVEPLTNYFVGRIQQEFNKGESMLGGMITAVNRKIDSPQLSDLHTEAYTGGADFKHSWRNREWYIAGNAEFSNVRGEPEAMVATQRSSARYFQRPDAKSFSVDSSATSLSGYGSTLKFGRTSQKLLQFETSLTARSPKLEFNDIGYMTYSDIIHQAVWAAFNVYNPFLIFNYLYFNTNHWMYWNFDGDFLSSNININYNTQFKKNKWRLSGNFNRKSQNISTSDLRGGPSVILPGEQSFSINLNTDYSKKFAITIGTWRSSRDASAGNAYDYWLTLQYRPTNAFLFKLEPSYSFQNHTLQYISEESVDNNPVLLFGNIKSHTMSFVIRANYTITPELSIEYYAQPFVSSGKYNSIKKITDSRAELFTDRFHIFDSNEITYNQEDNEYDIDSNGDGLSDITISNPDFNFKQLRSNLVLRWEYRPGSTFYFVWSQGRTRSTETREFSYGNDLKDLYGITPHNVFLVKFSYWFAL